MLCLKKNQNYTGFNINDIDSKKKPTHSSTAPKQQPHGTEEIGWQSL